MQCLQNENVLVAEPVHNGGGGNMATTATKLQMRLSNWKPVTNEVRGMAACETNYLNVSEFLNI